MRSSCSGSAIRGAATRAWRCRSIPRAIRSVTAWPLAGMDPADRFAVRLCIGLEDPADLIADLDARVRGDGPRHEATRRERRRTGRAVGRDARPDRLRHRHTRISVWSGLLLVVVVIGYASSSPGSAAGSCGACSRGSPSFDATQRLLAEKIVSIAIWALAIFVGMDILGIDLTALAVFSGAFGLAIGFGLQKTFGNLIAGIILLMDRSIKPGDVIAVNDGTGATSARSRRSAFARSR